MAKLSIQGLTYADTAKQGYKRLKSGTGFTYKNTRGKQIKSERTLKRIASLVIPPAWQKVWICTDPQGHIQCYGYDDRDRKQYIYHPKWSKQRNLRKFKKIHDLGDSLNALTRLINTDLKSTVWNKEKASALAMSVVKETLMRIGNAKYTKENKSYGLTTLKKTHLTFEDKALYIRYKGKKGVQQEHVIKDKRLYQYLHELYQLPGSTLFRYFPNEDSKKTIKLKPKHINRYLKTCCENKKVTVKSFRIWGASVLALRLMIQLRDAYDKDKAQTQLNAILDEVATALGNTREVTKKYYVHPILQELFLNGRLYRKIAASKKPIGSGRKQAEGFLLTLI